MRRIQISERKETLMNSNSKWMSATIGLVVVSLMFVAVEPAAFARGTEDPAKPEERVAENPTPQPLPNRPVIVTSKVAPADRVAQTIAQTPASRVPTPSMRPAAAYTPPKKQSSGKSKTWLYILLGAAGAGVTTALLIGGDDPPPPPIPTIEIGTPIVGGPQ
jgi:hypothetical protein